MESCKSQQPLLKSDVITPFENNQNTTATYLEAITYYYKLSEVYPNISVGTYGKTDSGHPLHEIIVTNDGNFNPSIIKKKEKVVLFINNAIHAGEPCGVDASMMLARDLLTTKSNLLDNVVVVIVPVYNIGGALNRGRHSRANQNGPTSYGFRGNAKNLDLNRDFIKCDSKNARSFIALFNKWNPEIFIDNHTSNGSDYQYIMTLIATQKDKLNPTLSKFLTETMLPELYSKMEDKKFEMTPYVYNMHATPDKGIMGFLDLGRYSSGYAAIHHSISFMPETHMLKPFKERVRSTYAFSESVLEHINDHHKSIVANHKKAYRESIEQKVWPLTWTLDTTSIEFLSFKGFTAKYKKSDIHGADRLYYDRNSKYEKSIKLYDKYTPNITVTKPEAYIIPQAYSEIVDLLKLNGVKVSTLQHDQSLEVEVYYIDDYSSTSHPYEGHYLHHSVQLQKETQTIKYHQGDYLVNTSQPETRFIIETLEPQGPDSYFAWNFFDGILMRKEHFSPYVWEDLAAKLLLEDPKLKKAFEEEKENNEDFASDSNAQLTFIYKNSPYYEPTYLRYPIGRILK